MKVGNTAYRWSLIPHFKAQKINGSFTGGVANRFDPSKAVSL